MTTLIVHDIPDEETQALAARAARNGRSLEAEVRAILRDVVRTEPHPEEGGLATAIRRRFAPYGGVEAIVPPRSDEKGLGTEIRELFAPIGGVELPPVPRTAAREPPSFD